MKNNLPSPSDLTYFLEVANLGNLSRAAESLGISQPSLTLAIYRIERVIGAEILNRHKRGVTLTVAGKQLLAHTRNLLQQWNVIKSETLASMHEVQGCFTLGCHCSLALYALPLFLTQLIHDHPNLDIHLQHDLSRRVVEQVINLKLDLGIVVNPTRHPDLVIHTLEHDKVTLWRNKAINCKSLDLTSGKAVILCDPELMQTQNILKKLKSHKLRYARILPSNNLEVIAELTLHGCGIGILPANVASKRNLSVVPKAPCHEDEICLLYRGENRNVKAMQTIVQYIKRAF